MTPIVSIVGQSGSGKTTLLVKLLSALVARRIRVGTIKHHSHPIEFDVPGKDTYLHRKAGAVRVCLAGGGQIVTIQEAKDEPSPRQLVAAYFRDLDLVIAEGYKSGELPKVEVYRPAISDGLLCADDPQLIAVATDAEADRLPQGLPIFGLSDPDPLADFLIDRFLTGK